MTLPVPPDGNPPEPLQNKLKFLGNILMKIAFSAG
jgi:hypothetical protein